MIWRLWLRYDHLAKDSKIGTWTEWTRGSLEEVLDDMFDWRAGRLHGFDAARLEAEKTSD